MRCEETMKKKKILLLSDHLLSTSGVGCQSRFLSFGLAEKGCWTVRQLGAAIKHENYDMAQPHPDILIKPVDGFGNRDQLRQLLSLLIVLHEEQALFLLC